MAWSSVNRIEIAGELPVLRIAVEVRSRMPFRTPMLAICAFEDGHQDHHSQRIDEFMGGIVTQLRSGGEITGKRNTVTVIHNPLLNPLIASGEEPRFAADRLAVIGMGKSSDMNLEAVRVFAALAANKARELRLPSFALHPSKDLGSPADAVGQALAEGAILALYRYDRFKSEDKDDRPPEIGQISILPGERDVDPGLAKGVADGEKLAAATITARDLATGPANLVTATHLGERARELAAAHGFSATIFGKAELQEMGCGGILAVNSGSAEPPVMGVLRYDCGRPGARTLAVVGKGVTFDTGGISIKPASDMHFMRHDKSGACAVLGFMQAAATMQLPINVLGIFGATDNMPSGSAYRPGDVIRSYSGKNMEILNTDAEGRVVLADCLAYAVEQKPDAIVDMATLTGACVVALGHACSGLFSNNDALSAGLVQAGEAAGERLWRMPLWDEYREQIKAPLGDIKNIGGQAAGAITAAWFLANFVGDTPWAHLDIAGTAWTEGSWAVTPPYLQRDMATGVGVRLLTHFAQAWA
ncbi:MAG: Leucyl aminopeptidase [Chloroflexi bacterium]|nr:Leucyl aminopeptidase [Chloroflexota bacterium]